MSGAAPPEATADWTAGFGDAATLVGVTPPAPAPGML
jgi:hypothetical protein